MRTKISMTVLAGLLVISSVSAALATPAENNAPGLERVPVLISFRQTPGPSEQALVRSHGGTIKHSYHLVRGIAASIPQPAIAGLANNPNVTEVEPDLTVFAFDELDSCWGVKHIGAGIVHGTGNRGTGVKVAIIDSGIDYNHSDLNDNYAGGYDFANDDADPMDDYGHGTHVAGTVAAEDNGYGAVGVAPDADIYALKVITASGSGSYSDVIAALQWAVDNGIQVTNNSYGSSAYPGTLVKNAFKNAEAAGIVNICAAGNYGNSAGTGENMIYPARFDSCIAVAATLSNDTKASFSSTGAEMLLAAPGSSIYSTSRGGGYTYMSGTSMACPHVAGTAALVIAAGIGDVRTQLINTADDLGEPGWDPVFGFGLVNAVAAVEGSDEIDPDPVADFAGIPISGDAPLNVNFTNMSTGNPTAWSWSFGDEGETSTSTLQYPPTHTYTTVGTYTVSLTVTGPGGSEDTLTKTNYITVSEPAAVSPVANAGSDQTVSDGGDDAAELVTLDGSASYDPDGRIESIEWDLNGDGDADAFDTFLLVDVEFVIGTHTVTLTVTDDDGLEDTDDVIITVNANQPPVAIAGSDQTVSDDDGDGAEWVILDGSASNDPDGMIYSIEWDLGIYIDSEILEPSSSLVNVKYGIGTHSVTLTVTDNYGLTGTDVVIIKVTEPEPEPDPATTMYLAGLEGQYVRLSGGNWGAAVTVTVRDTNQYAVEGASITGTFTQTGLEETVSSGTVTTNSNGTITLYSGPLSKKEKEVTFTVTSIDHTTREIEYDSDFEGGIPDYIVISK